MSNKVDELHYALQQSTEIMELAEKSFTLEKDGDMKMLLQAAIDRNHRVLSED